MLIDKPLIPSFQTQELSNGKLNQPEKNQPQEHTVFEHRYVSPINFLEICGNGMCKKQKKKTRKIGRIGRNLSPILKLAIIQHYTINFDITKWGMTKFNLIQITKSNPFQITQSNLILTVWRWTPSLRSLVMAKQSFLTIATMALPLYSKIYKNNLIPQCLNYIQAKNSKRMAVMLLKRNAPVLGPLLELSWNKVWES